MKILIKNSTFDLPWNYLKLCEYRLSLLKKTPHLNSESPSELKNSKTEVSLKLYLKKPQFIKETIYSRNLHHLPLRMLKAFVAIADNFNRHFFFVRQSQWPLFFISWQPTLYGAVTVSMHPKIILDQLENQLLYLTTFKISNLNLKPPKAYKIRRLWEMTLINFLINTYLWWKFTLPTSCKY